MKVDQIKLNAENYYNSTKFETIKYGIGINVNLNKLNIDKLKFNNSKNKIDIIANKSVKIIDFSKLKTEINYINKLIKEDENKIISLHFSRFNSEKLIIIPKDTIITEPIIINSDSQDETDLYNIIIIAEESSKANIIEISKSNNKTKLKSNIIQIFANKNSNIKYNYINLNDKKTNCFNIKRSEIKKDANIDFLDVNLGSNFNQNSNKTYLKESGANTNNYAIYFTNEKQNYDIDIENIHDGSNTNSNIISKAILDDESKIIYRSNINVNKNCKRCNGHQKENTLLISKDSKIDAVPMLEINNEDVNISHGVTISDIEEEKLYYLKSRGLDEEQSKEIIIRGFINELIDKIEDKNILQLVEKEINKKLKK